MKNLRLRFGRSVCNSGRSASTLGQIALAAAILVGTLVGEGWGWNYIGTTTPSSPNESPGVNQMEGNRFQASASFTAVTMKFRVSAAAGNISLAIYSDNASAPGSKLGETNSTAVTATGWMSIPLISGVSITSGSYYWLCMNQDDALLGGYMDFGPGFEYYKNQTFGSWPATFGPATGPDDGIVAIQATDSGAPAVSKIWDGSSSTAWNTADNWTTNAVPVDNDLIIFNSSSTANLSTTNDISGLNGLAFQVVGPTGPVTVTHATNTIGLGSSGIDMSAATQNLTLAVPLSLEAAQTWTVASGRTLTVSGAVTNGANLLTVNSSGTTTISGILGNGTGGVTKTGTGTLVLSAANTYTGATTVSAGVLNIRHNTATGTTAGGVAVASGAALQLQGGITVGAEALQLIGTGGGNGALRNISGVNTWGGTVTLATSAATIQSDADTLKLTAANSVTGTNIGLVLQGSGHGRITGTITTGSGAITKSGSGTWTLSGDGSSNSGGTAVNAGTLDYTGDNNGSTMTVNSGGTLEINSSGPGSAMSDDFTLVAGGTLVIDLNGATTPGTNYDQLAVTGTVTLGGTLSLSLNYTPTVGHTYTIISNDGTDPVTGTFNGLAQGAQISSGSYYFTVSYTGGDGNDVVLTNISVVAPINTTVAITDNGLYTNDPTPLVTVDADSCDSIRMAANWDTAGVPYEYRASFPATDSVDISAGGDGWKYVRVKFKNDYGNSSGWISDSTIYDGTAPTSAVTTAGSFNAVTWGDTLRGTQSDGGILPSGVQILNLRIIRHGTTDAYYNGTTWQGGAVEVTATLSSGAWKYPLPDSKLTDASYTIESRAVDGAGNSQSPSGSGTFTFDNSGPTGSITILDSSGYTSDATPLVRIDTTTWADSLRTTADTNAAGVFKAFVYFDSVTLSSEGPSRIFVKLKDGVGNTSAWLSDLTVYDYTAPTCSVTTSGAHNAASWPGSIAGTASDARSGIRLVEVQVQRQTPAGYWNGTDWSSPTPVWVTAVKGSGSAWSLSLSASNFTDASYAIQAHVVDSAYNDYTANGSFVFSNSGPSGVGISITEMVAGFTSDPDPRLTLSVGNPVRMEMRVGLSADTTTATWKAYAQYDSSVLISTPATDHGVRIFAQFRDSVGNVSPWVSDTTVYDATAPATAVTSSGTYITSTWSGVVSGTASDLMSGVDSVYVSVQRASNNRYWSGTGWVDSASIVWLPANGTENWSLPLAQMSDDLYQVSVRGVDRVDNRQALPSTGAFSYDATPPTGGQVLIMDQNGSTNDADPPLRITVGGTKVQMRIAFGSDTTVWAPHVQSDSVDISAGGDGLKRVYVQFRDSLGNATGWVYDSTRYDGTVPASQVLVSGQFSPSTWKDSVWGSASDAASGVESVYVSVRCDTTSRYWNSVTWVTAETWLAATGTTSWYAHLPAGVLQDSRYTARCRAIDSAGNAQATPATGTFTYNLPPVARFSASPTSTPAGGTVQFSDSSTGAITSWYWQFGDAGTSTLQNPSHVYADTGTFAVTLTVTGPGGVGSSTVDGCVFVFGEGQNPVKIAGRYLGPTSVAIAFSNLLQVDRDFPPPMADSLRLYARRVALPTEPQGAQDSLVATYYLGDIAGTTGRYTDTVTVSPLTGSDSTYGFMTSVVWIGDAPSLFRTDNGTVVLMRDTTRPENALYFDDTATWHDSTLTVYLDSLESLDTTVADAVLLWYGFSASDGYSAARGERIAVSDLLAGASGGRYAWTATDVAFDGARQTVQVRAVVQGRSSLYSLDTAKAAYGIGTDRPPNNLVLAAAAISSDAIRLSWSSASGFDSVRVWYGVDPVPLTYAVPQTDYSVIRPAVSDTADTVTGLTPATLYYFGLQVCRNRLWSAITEYSSDEDSTWPADTSGLVNSIAIQGILFDSATHNIVIDWTVDTSGEAGLQFGVRYGVAALNDSTPARWSAVPGADNQTTVSLNEDPVFGGLYYVSMWLRRSGGMPVAPTDSSRDTVRLPGYSWQRVVNFGASDTVRAFNGMVVFINAATGGSGSIPADTVDIFRPDSAELNGFVTVSIGFSFRAPEQTPPLYAGLVFNPALIPVGYGEDDVRIYRQDAGGLWIVERAAVLDSAHHWILLPIDASQPGSTPLEYPLIAMIDTMPPVSLVSSDSSTVIGIDGVTDALDTIALHDNTANVQWTLWHARGGDDVYAGSPRAGATLAAVRDTVITAVSGSAASDNGLRIMLVVNDGVHYDTVDLSRRAFRDRSEEVTAAQEWCPLHVTVNLSDTSAEGVFGDSATGSWAYDSTQLRLFRFVTWSGNAAAPDTERWAEYSFSPDSLFAFTPGRLMWVKTLELYRVSYGSGITPSLKDSVEIALPPQQWTDICVPYAFDMRLGDVRGGVNDSLDWYHWRKTRQSARADSTYFSFPLYLPGVSGSDTAVLASGSGQGYTVLNWSRDTMKIRFPAIPRVMSKVTAGSGALPKRAAGGSWCVRIDAGVLNGPGMTPVFCGMQAGLSRPRSSPLAPSFGAVRMGVLAGHANGLQGYSLVGETGGNAFEVVFANTGRVAQHIGFTTAAERALPSGMAAAIFNPETREFESPDSGRFAVAVDKKSVEYRWLVVGDAAYMNRFKAGFPAWRLGLLAAYPNPFRNRVTLRYVIPYAGVKDLQFTVLDMMGRCVWRKDVGSTIRPGEHLLTWDARSSVSAQRVSTGMYLIRMSARDDKGKRRSFTQTVALVR